MNKYVNPTTCGRNLAARVFWLVTTATVAVGQVAPAPSAAPAEEPVVLSPFVVDATKDTGYIPDRDVSGTRLNAPLRDVAAPVTVFTKEILEDLNATSILDVRDFAPNVEAPEATNGTGDISPAPVRIRGQNSSFIQTQDFFKVYDELDTYKLERVGFARGPNSLLFGLGEALGTLVSTGKRARFQDFNEITFRADSWGSLRGTIETNQELIEDRLAARLVLLKQKRESAMRRAYRSDERAYFTFTARLVDLPDLKTTLRASFEGISGKDAPGAERLPADAVSTWIAAGRPIGNFSAGLPAGTANQSSSDMLVWINGGNNDIPIMNWRNTLTSVGPDGNSRAVLDESIFPYDVNIRGDSAVAPRHIKSTMVFLEQQVGQDLFFEVALFRGTEDRWQLVNINPITLRADPNEFLPNGAPNPNKGKYYADFDGSNTHRIGTQENIRLSSSYLLDFAKFNERLGYWAGRHNFLAMYEYGERDDIIERMRAVNTTPLPGYPALLSSSQNFVTRRSYLDYSKGVYSLNQGNPMHGFSRDGVTVENLPVNNQTRSLALQESISLMLNSYLFGDRLVATVGWREDDATSYSRNVVAGGPEGDARGVLPYARTFNVKQKAFKSFDLIRHPISKMFVFKPLPIKWIQFHYSEGENFAAAAAGQVDLYNRVIAPQAGEGKDYGFRLFLFNERLDLYFNKYEGGSVNVRNNLDNAGEINAIWDALNRPDKRVDTTGRDTTSNTSEGWEAQITYNPTRNWRIYANVTKNMVTSTDIFPVTRAYLAENIPVWQQSSSVVTANGQTIGQLISVIQSQHATRIGAEGIPNALGGAEWNGALMTRYSFTEGLLKGAHVGLNLRYRGSVFLTTTGRFKEDPYTTIGINLGYQMKLRSRYTLKTQLGIENAFDWDGRLIRSQANGSGYATRVRWLPGTSAVLTTTLSF